MGRRREIAGTTSRDRERRLANIPLLHAGRSLFVPLLARCTAHARPDDARALLPARRAAAPFYYYRRWAPLSLKGQPPPLFVLIRTPTSACGSNRLLRHDFPIPPSPPPFKRDDFPLFGPGKCAATAFPLPPSVRARRNYCVVAVDDDLCCDELKCYRKQRVVEAGLQHRRCPASTCVCVAGNEGPPEQSKPENEGEKKDGAPALALRS